MRQRRYLALVVALLVIAGCAQDAGDPAELVQAYIQARTGGDAETLRSLSCAAWEEQAVIQAQSFQSVDATLDGMACSRSGTDGDFTLVACEGRILMTYDAEVRERPLGMYRVVQEDGVWKLCGEG